MIQYFILYLATVGGWAFSSTDLIKNFDKQQIDNVLSNLVKAKKQEEY
jgi:hypothetical protein